MAISKTRSNIAAVAMTFFASALPAFSQSGSTSPAPGKPPVSAAANIATGGHQKPSGTVSPPTPLPPPQGNSDSLERELTIIVDIFQILGSLGVVVALFVAVRQWRSTSATSAHTSAQSHVAALNSFFLALASDENLATIYRQGRADPNSLSAKDKDRFFYLCVVWFAHHEYAFQHSKVGLLPENFFQSWDEALREDLLDEGLRSYWLKEGRFFDAPFRAYVDAIIKSTTPP